jgi:hypothetical protein
MSEAFHAFGAALLGPPRKVKGIRKIARERETFTLVSMDREGKVIATKAALVRNYLTADERAVYDLLYCVTASSLSRRARGKLAARRSRMWAWCRARWAAERRRYRSVKVPHVESVDKQGRITLEKTYGNPGGDRGYKVETYVDQHGKERKRKVRDGKVGENRQPVCGVKLSGGRDVVTSHHMEG